MPLKEGKYQCYLHHPSTHSKFFRNTFSCTIACEKKINLICFNALKLAHIFVDGHEIQNNTKKNPKTVMSSYLRSVTEELLPYVCNAHILRLSKCFYSIADKLDAHLVILTQTSCESLLEL